MCFMLMPVTFCFGLSLTDFGNIPSFLAEMTFRIFEVTVLQQMCTSTSITLGCTNRQVAALGLFSARTVSVLGVVLLEGPLHYVLQLLLPERPPLLF